MIERSSLLQLSLARWRMFIREPSGVFWTFGFPILMSLALGIAFRNKAPEPARVAIVAGEGAEQTLRALSGEEFRAKVMESPDAEKALRTGKVSVVVTPLPGSDPEHPIRSYHFDESRPESRIARLVVDDRLQRDDGRKDPTQVRDLRVTEPGARYIDFLIPGIIGMNVMSSGMWGIGYVLVELRTKKLVKRMIATPMRKGEFLLSFILMRMAVLILELPILLVFGHFAFGVEMHGSLLLFVAVVVLGALAFAGLGLLVASRAENVQTVGGLMNLVMLPMFVMSGVFFSSENFPEAMQPLIRALPLSALNDSLRAVMNEGEGVVGIAVPAAILATWGAVSFAIALKVFRWR